MRQVLTGRLLPGLTGCISWAAIWNHQETSPEKVPAPNVYWPGNTVLILSGVIEMMHRFGGDAVGMSTVPEAVFAASKGMKAASISCITNYAAGISNQKLSHSEVTETAAFVEDKFTTASGGVLITTILALLLQLLQLVPS